MRRSKASVPRTRGRHRGAFSVLGADLAGENGTEVMAAAAPSAGGAPSPPEVWPVPAPPPVFLGGSREAEAQRMASAARELVQLQQELRAVSADGRPGRAFHRMGVAFRASYQPLPAGQLDPRLVPPEIRTALLDPGLRVLDGFARFSHGRGDDNVNGLMPDVRGLWVRLLTSAGVQDLTATNAEVPFFDDPEELLAFGFATRQLVQEMRAHPLLTPAAVLRYEPELAAQLMRLKPAEFPSKLGAHRRAAAMLAAVAAPGLPVHSLAETQFWGGAPLYIRGTDGRAYAFKFTFKPDPVPGLPGLPTSDLFAELGSRQQVHYELRVQLYVDDQNTPIERPAKWHVRDAKVGDVGIATGEARIDARVDGEGSNPATNLDGLSPAGLNRLRVDLYATSARARGGHPVPDGRLFGES
jgi:hypothetical protein